LWDDKWLNATVTIDKIADQIEEKVRIINGNLATIAALPEFSYEAEELYKKSLDFGEAIRKAKEMSEMQKRKAAAEQAKAEAQAEQAKTAQAIPVDPQNGEIQANADDRLKIERIGTPVEQPKQPQIATQAEPPKIYTFRFEVSLTAAQAAAMGAWCKAQGITLKQIK
jgi:hypothetical protein